MDRQLSLQLPPGLPSFPSRSVISQVCTPEWCRRGAAWEKPPYFGVEKPLGGGEETERERRGRQREGGREREEEEEDYYIISTFFPPPLK